MSTFVNSFEEGTSGTTLSTGNSGGQGQNPFDVVTIGAGAALAFDSAHAAHGGLGLQLATPVAAQVTYAQWSASVGTQGQLWFREYLFLTANPAANFRVITFLDSGAVLCGFVQVTTTGKLQFLNTNSVLIFTTTNSVPLNQWFRIEGFILGGNPTGQVELSLFSPMDSVVPTETQTSSSSQNTRAAISLTRMGVGAAVASVTAFWMDDLGLSTTGYMGPALPPGPQPGLQRRTGFSPKWAPSRRLVSGRRAEPPWPQGNRGTAAPLSLRQAGGRPKTGPWVRLGRGRMLAPGWGQFIPVPVVPGLAALSAASSMVVAAKSGPDLELLWAQYLAIASATDLDRRLWRMTRGSIDEETYQFEAYYTADQAKDVAYQIWLDAYNGWNR